MLPSSYHKSNNHDDGPFRAVVGVHVCDTGYRREDLVCGHTGNVLPNADWAKPGKRRRCWRCRDDLNRAALAAEETS